MNTEVIVAAIVFAGGALTVLVNYLLGKRTNSGTVSTSDAASLWKESNELRAEYKQRAEKLEARLEEVNNQLSEVMSQLNQLKGSNIEMESQIKELQRVIAELREENQRLLALKRDL